MLLQRLKEYADNRGEALPPPFYRVRPVRWTIRLQPDGTPSSPSLLDRADSDHPGGESMAVPYIYRSGVRPPAMLLADDLRYVLDFQANEAERAHGGSRRNQDFIALAQRWRDSAPDDPTASAVASFFERGLHKSLLIDTGAAKPTDVAAIWVDGDWAHNRDSAKAFWASAARERKASGNAGVCLVCGQYGPLLATVPGAVKAGAIPAGSGRGRDAQLLSVNKAAQGRGGKIQLASAPVCDGCGSAVMSALNELLADGQSRYRTDDSVFTWWLRGTGDFPELNWLNKPEPDQVRHLIAGLHEPRGESTSGGVDTSAFCAATLSVNQSRVVVRDWLEVPVRDAQEHIGRWFAHHQAPDLWQDGLHQVPLWRLAVCTGRWAAENGQDRYQPRFMPHGCERDLLLAALKGTRPPAYLLPHLLQRIRADGHIDLPRVALLRLILVRSADSPKEDYMAGLQPDLPILPYQCGRMFAVLEQIQRAALGRDVNSTIADRYMAAATATPLPILTMLRKNANGHLRRLRRTSEGAYYALSSHLDEVMAQIPADVGIPANLGLEGQAEFILGYHHQRAADIALARARSQKKQASDSDNDTGEAE
jgi:CRISPR-associated protein Csd1